MTSLEKRAPSDAEKRVSCNEPLESAREDGRLFGYVTSHGSISIPVFVEQLL